MRPTQLRSYNLPVVGATAAAPTAVASAGEHATRVLVRNTSATAALLAVSYGDISALSAAMYRLPGGAVDALIIAPDQQVFAMGEGVGCQISVAVSEAFPVEIRG